MPYYQQELIISQLFIGVFFGRYPPMNNANNLKSILLDLIDQLDENKQTFLLNPHSDFSRKRKFSFHTLVNFILCLEAGSLKDELYNFLIITWIRLLPLLLFSRDPRLAMKLLHPYFIHLMLLLTIGTAVYIKATDFLPLMAHLSLFVWIL